MVSMLLKQIYEELQGMGIGQAHEVNGGDAVEYLNALLERLKVVVNIPETGVLIEPCGFSKVVRHLRSLANYPSSSKLPIYFSPRLLFIVSMGEEGNMVRLKQESDRSFWCDMTKDELTDCLEVEDWVVFDDYCTSFHRYNKATKAPATPKPPREFS